MNAFDTLFERGFIKQTSHEDEIRDLLGNDKATFYIGFDPTADSLHVGHYVPLVAMAHLQRAGHRPIVLIGGGTTMVGDPSGRTDMRRMLTKEDIAANARKFQSQIGRLVDFSNGRALMENNADWLLNLNYIEFLRDIGVHFSVNRMLTAECFKQRMEKGLSFFEFNYMLMQSYDFLVLHRKYGCCLQLGGDDQWSNILEGADLIRRKEGRKAYALTLSLLTTSQGLKMGKTQKGALWLDENKTSVHEFYQYFRNVADDDVERCLKLLTFVPLPEIEELCGDRSRVNEAKQRLAYELCSQVHGEEKAKAAREAALSLFGGGRDSLSIPETVLSMSDFEANPRLIDLMAFSGMAKSKGEVRRLIEQGGVMVNDAKVSDAEFAPDKAALQEGMLVQRGKKVFRRFVLKA